MEPCADHSGFKVQLIEHDRRLEKYEQNISRVHKRLDETNLLIGEVRADVNTKLDEAMRIFSDPKSGVIMGENGLKSQVDNLSRSQRLFWRVLCFVFGPPVLVLIAYISRKIAIAIKGVL